jgi:transcriptional regulator with XRE-family HTH domain
MSSHLRIKTRRKELGLTQRNIAEMVGVSSATISQWENGETAPGGFNFVKLVSALQTTNEWVIHGEKSGIRRILVASQVDHRIAHALTNVTKEMAIIPTEIFNIASKFGVLISYEKMDDWVCGRIKKSKHHYSITLNKKHSEDFKRFTSASLIGHFILHKDHLNDLKDGLAVNSLFMSGLGKSLDDQANKAAIDILMPLKKVRERVRASPEISLACLAQEFEVPVSAMSIRLGVPAKD